MPTMHLDRVETDLRLDTYHPIPIGLRSPVKPTAHAETDAHRLRAKGLSYRRIATQLRVRYDLVSRWLSGPPPAAPVPEPLPHPPAPASLQATAVLPERLTDTRELTERIDNVMATLRQVSLDGQQREDRMYQLIEQELEAVKEREQRRDAELTAMRAILDALAGRSGVAAAAVGLPPPKLGFWRRGTGR